VNQTAVIIIFGAAVRPGGKPSGAMLRRVEAALAFGATLAEPIYLPTGGLGRHPPIESRMMAQMLLARGVPAARIVEEPTATNTLRSVRAIRKILRERSFCGPVYAASSHYHLPRCLALLRLAGIPARACPPPPPAKDVGLGRRVWQVTREIPALPADSLYVLALRAVRRM